jgi:microcystin-dependent protein
MSESLHTRRRLLQSGFGGAVALAAAQAGVLAAPRGARAASTGVLPGEVRLFGGDYAPRGWKLAPGLGGRALMGDGTVPDGPHRQVGERGAGAAVRDRDHEASTLGLTYLVAEEAGALDPFVGEIRAFAFDFAPRGWIPCDARRLEIARHSELFVVVGPHFGGNLGVGTFALPDLRDRTPLAVGDGDGVPSAPFAGERENLDISGAGRRPRLHLNFCIAERGEFPRKPGS